MCILCIPYVVSAVMLCMVLPRKLNWSRCEGCSKFILAVPMLPAVAVLDVILVFMPAWKLLLRGHSGAGGQSAPMPNPTLCLTLTVR